MPYPSEHACRLRQPGAFTAGSFRRVTRKHEGKTYAVIMGRLKGEDTMTEQAYRYPKGTWTPEAARAHCRAHDGKSFEQAGEPKARACRACREASGDELAAEVARHRAAPEPPARLRVVAEAGTSEAADVYLYDSIGGWLGVQPGAVVAALEALHGRPVTVHINSPGGDVFDGLAIYNVLREYPGGVTTVVEGLAASIASIIALAGTRLVMRPASFYMIHDPHGVAIGGAARLRHLAALLDKAGGLLGELYARKVDAPVETVREWMAAETWYTAAEALEAGFADELVETEPNIAEAAAARFDLSAYQHVPAALLVPPPAPPPAPVVRPPRARERAATLAASLRYLVGV